MASLADNLKTRRASELEHRGRPKIDLSRAKDSAGKLDRVVASLADLLPKMDEGGRLAYDESGNIVGGYDPEGQVEKAINWLMPAGSVAEAVDTGKGLAKGVLKTFGGIGAKTADKEALAAAEALEKSGADMRDIWQRTGYFRAPWDGKWRFEIDDSGINSMIPLDKWVDRRDGKFMAPNISAAWDSAAESLTPNAPVRAKRLYEHPLLSRAYPDGWTDNYQHQDIMGLPVKIHPEGSGSAGSFGDGELALNAALMPRDAKSVMLHELQHAIQQREGFARGGSPDMAFRDPRMWGKDGAQGSDIAHKMLDEKLAQMSAPISIEQYAKQAWGSDAVTPEIAADYAEYAKSAAKPLPRDVVSAAQKTVASDWYKRLAGEAEARLVQDRLPLTAAQRREQYPLDGLAAMLAREGIDPGDNFSNLITRYGDGPAMSVEPDLSRYGIGAPELRSATDNSLASTLERMRARNLGKGLDEDMATGAVRDEIARRNGVAMLGLPEDHTAMDRAKKMGYQTPAYHGTTQNVVPGFSIEKSGSNTGHANTGGVIYTSASPSVSNNYNRSMPAAKKLNTRIDANDAERSKVQSRLIDLAYKGKVGGKSGVDLSYAINGHSLKPSEIQRLKEANPGAATDEFINLATNYPKQSLVPYSETNGYKVSLANMTGGNSMPLLLNTKGNSKLSAKDFEKTFLAPKDVSDWRDLIYGEKADELAAQLQEFTKDGGLTVGAGKSLGWGDTMDKQYIMSNPAKVRSRFAAFDPSLRDSANLLASLAGAAVLAPTLADYLDKFK